MSAAPQNPALNPAYLFIALLPMAAFVAGNLLLERSAPSFDWMPKEFAEFDASRAEALRLEVFGYFLLFTVGAIGAFLYFLYTLRLVERPIAAVVYLVFLVTIAILATSLVLSKRSQADKFVNSALVCTALGYDEDQSRRGKEAAKARAKADEAKMTAAEKIAAASANALAAQQPARVRIEDIRGAGEACGPATLAQVDWLLRFNKLGVLIGLTSLVFGSILCLAGPLPSGPADPDKQLLHYQDQAERLNTYLYLSALLLVTGLLFASALLHWPTHALLPAAAPSFKAQVNALTAFYGISYTVVLASFYIPVAMLLSARVKALKALKGPAPAGEAVPNAFKGPVQILKVAAAIFSPTLVSLLGGLASLG